MSKITAINRDTLRILQAAINEALAPVAAEYGISLSMAGATFGDTYATLKVQAAVITEGGVQTKEASAMKQYAGAFGLKPEDLGRTFEHGGHRYTILGLVVRSRKILTARPDGKQYTWKAEAVKRALEVTP